MWILWLKNPKSTQNRPYLSLQLLPNCSHQKFEHALKKAWPHRYPYESGPSKPDQKVDPLGGPFGSPVISK